VFNYKVSYEVNSKEIKYLIARKLYLETKQPAHVVLSRTKGEEMTQNSTTVLEFRIGEKSRGH
jgi:hypothetical protein